MTSPVVAWMADVSSIWEALTPPDRANVTYHEIADNEARSWAVLNRGFEWKPPVRSRVRGEAAGGITALVEWKVSVAYYLHRRGRGSTLFAAAVANETTQLMTALETTTVWPAGVSEAITASRDTQVLEIENEDGEVEGAEVTLSFTVVCEESN